MSFGFKAFGTTIMAVGFGLMVGACGESGSSSARQSAADTAGTKLITATSTVAKATTPARTRASTTATSTMATITSEQVCQAFTPSKVTSLISYPVTKAMPNTAAIIKTVGCDYDNDTDGLVLGIQITSLPGTYDDDKATDSSAGAIEPIQVGREGFFSVPTAAAELKVGDQVVVIQWSSVGNGGLVSADAARTASTNLGKTVIAKFFPVYAR